MKMRKNKSNARKEPDLHHIKAAPTHSYRLHKMIIDENNQNNQDEEIERELEYEFADAIRDSLTRLENEPRFTGEIRSIRELARLHGVSESYILFGEESRRRFYTSFNRPKSGNFIRKDGDISKPYLVDYKDQSKVIHEDMLFLAYAKCDHCEFDPKKYVFKPKMHEIRERKTGIAEESLLYFVKMQMVMSEHANETGHSLHGSLFFPSKFVKIKPGLYFRIKKLWNNLRYLKT